MAGFSGLTQSVFDTYAPEKWSSNVHNLARMKAKDIVVALAKGVQGELAEELQDLARAASDEIPTITNQKKVEAQWVYWYRSPQAREALASFLRETPLHQDQIFHIAPHEKHVALGIILRQHELWAGLWIAPSASVDRRNLAMKLGKSWERERFTECLSKLPDDLTAQIGGHCWPIAKIGSEQIDTMIAELQAPPNGANTALSIGVSMPPMTAIDADTTLKDALATHLGPLLELYAFIAWSRDNDFIEANKKLQEEKVQKRRQATSFQPGDRVRIVNGLFSGKLGVVQDIDTRAQVRVQVGTMSVVVSGAGLTPA